MRVYTFQADGPVLIPEGNISTPSGPRIAFVEEYPFPLDGYWRANDEIIGVNNPLIAGQRWICISEGKPGTWVSKRAGAGINLIGALNFQVGAVLYKVGVIGAVQNPATGRYYIGWSGTGVVLNAANQVIISITPRESYLIATLITIGDGYGFEVGFNNASGVATTPTGFQVLVSYIENPSLFPTALPAL